MNNRVITGGLHLCKHYLVLILLKVWVNKKIYFLNLMMYELSFFFNNTSRIQKISCAQMDFNNLITVVYDWQLMFQGIS